jgi:hypothetical protein
MLPLPLVVLLLLPLPLVVVVAAAAPAAVTARRLQWKKASLKWQAKQTCLPLVKNGSLVGVEVTWQQVLARQQLH